MWVSFIESIAIVVKYPGSVIYSNAFPAEFTFTNLFAPPVKLAGVSVSPAKVDDPPPPPPPDIVIVFTVPVPLAVTPAPTKFSVVASVVRGVPSSCTVIVLPEL